MYYIKTVILLFIRLSHVFLLRKIILLIQKNMYICRARQDMKFASISGFTKLLVGTGCDTLEETQKEEDTCPDYYLPSLGQLFSAYTSPQCQPTVSE